jgi:Domain of unknown function (DUF4192)
MRGTIFLLLRVQPLLGKAVMNTTTLTRAEVKEAIDTYFTATLTNKPELITSEVTDKISEGITTDVQLRDYVMGLVDDHNLINATKVVEAMVYELPEGNRRSLYCVLSSYAYEAGDKNRAIAHLTSALDEDPEYSLAKLLERVYKAEWPFNAFAEMRGQCHPKVVDGLDDRVIDPRT